MTKMAMGVMVLTLLVTNAPSMASTLSNCEAETSAFNQYLPRAVDSYTDLQTTVCINEGKTVALRYIYAVKVLKAQLTAEAIAEQRALVRNGMCSTPQQRQLVNSMNVESAYYDSGGSYIFSVRIRKQDCP